MDEFGIEFFHQVAIRNLELSGNPYGTAIGRKRIIAGYLLAKPLAFPKIGELILEL
jgi:hypothetical protein